MNRERWEQIKQIFGDALEQDSADRQAFVREAAKGDTELLSELLRLLDESERDSEFLSRPALEGSPLLASEEMPRFAPENLLGERYRVVRFIARGGMGEVYEADDLELGGRVAIKVLRRRAAPGGDLPALMKNEVQLARRVTHPNVCRIFDLIQHDGILLLSMELIEGRTLSTYLKESGPMDFRDALPLIEEIAAGLQAIHNAGIIHGDLKPGNIMLASSPGDLHPKAVVMDFGMALPVAPGVDAPVRRGGTPDYSAPEQSDGAPISPATDMYALALMIADMLGVPRSGRLKPDTDRMPAKWASALRRCLQKDPSLRYAHPADLVKTLHRATAFRKRLIVFACATVAVVVLTLTVAPLLRQPFNSPTSTAPQRFLTGGDQVPALVTPESHHSESTLRFQERDWVMLEGFENRTGEALFDRTLQEALERELSNSEFLIVAPRERVEDALRLMKQPSDTVLTAAQAREVCLRDGAIRALVTGRIEKVGSTYLVSAEVIDPVQNRALASDTETAPGQDQIWPAVRRLSNWVRETLGETMERIDRSNRQLEKVTTPSLRAVQLFTEADSASRREDWAVSAQLMRQALIEDPDFASARTWLAWALKNLGDPEWKTEAQKALDLSGAISERERYFVQGSYERMMGHPDRAIPPLEALSRRYPDHYFAYRNLMRIYAERGSVEDAARTAGRFADAKPNDFEANADATHQYLSVDMARAKRYAQRANNLQPLRPAEPLFFHAHELWMRDDAQGAFAEVQRIAARLSDSDPKWRRGISQIIASFLLTLGRFKDCQQMVDSLDNPPPGWSALVAFFKGDDDRTRQIAGLIEANPQVNPLGNLNFPSFLIARFQPGAEKKLGGENDPNYALVRGEIALHEGRFEDAVRVLQAEFDDRSSKYRFSTQWIADGLVTALEQTGESQKALEVLRTTSSTRMWATPLSISAYQNFWLRDQARLSAYYHRLGRQAEAQKIDDQLRKLLAVADSDHPILRQLNGR